MPIVRRFHTLGWALLIAVAALVLGRTFGRAQTPTGDQLEQGARLFAANCAVCHGADGQGRVGATLAKNWSAIRPDLRIRETIANGIQGSVMPAWSQVNGGPLSEADIDALTAFILSWETGSPQNFLPLPTLGARPPITPIPNVEGDPNHGAVLFDQNCAVCHGQNGEGRVGATLAKAWSSIRADLRIKSTIEAGIPGSVMPAWSQANGGPLTASEINDLVAFILTLPAVEQVQPTQSSPIAGGASPLSGWLGIAVFVILLGVFIGVALLIQTRR
jgi:ubiquinol-cytochrome c reductase cytochrome c subunit